MSQAFQAFLGQSDFEPSHLDQKMPYLSIIARSEESQEQNPFLTV